MRFFKVSAIAFLLLIPLSVFGKDMDFKFTAPVEISADFVEHNRENNTFTARGNVDLKEGLQSLTADYVLYNDNTKDVLAEGNVIFNEEEDRVECDKLTLNLETKEGTLENARIFIKKGNFYIAGEEMKKVGESRYTMARGEFTTCGWDKPAWKFSAKDIDITVDGYATTKNTKFHILDYPVFYLPWGMFPVKTERQSGFLIPEIALSTRNGTMVNNAYFWAISKDKDATFYANYIGNKGVNLGGEFRYMPKEDYKGNWQFFVIQDRDYNNTRWQLKGQHEQKFYGDLQLKSDVRFVSDEDYLKDFGNIHAERSETQLKSTAYLEKPFKKSLLTTEMAYFRNLLTKDNDYTYKHLPHISFFTEYIPFFRDKLFTDVSSDFTTFYREKGDTYSRLGFEPKIRFPYSLKGVNFLVSGRLIETAYLTGKSDTFNKDTAYRQIFHLEGDANMQFIRNYSTDNFGIGEVQSLIRPQLKYNFIPNSSFRNIPDIDPYDRLNKTNSITYSFNHYLYGLKEGAQRELALFEVSQTYGLSGNLDESVLYSGYGNRLSDIDARIRLFPMTNLSFTNQTIWNVYGEGLKTMRNGFNYDVEGKYHVNISHSYTMDFNNEVFFDIGGIYDKFEGGYQMRYSFKDSGWIETLYKLTYRPSCWSVTVSLTQTRRPNDTRIGIIFNLAGLTDIGIF
jgi:LPS-assembly protein